VEHRLTRLASISFWLVLTLAACGADGGSPADGGDTGDRGDAPDGDAVTLARRECPGEPDCLDEGDGVLRAGAAVVDITPLDLKEGPSFVDTDGDAQYDRRTDSFTDADGDGRFDAF